MNDLRRETRTRAPAETTSQVTPPRALLGAGRHGLAAFSAALVIALAALVAVAPSITGGFVFDDHSLVERGELLRGPLWRLWLTTDAVDYWPLTYSTFWLEWRVWGAAPLGYRLVNLALHAGVAVLLWRVLRRLAVPGAWLAGLLFAVHPVTVESVAWISERKNVLSGVLYLGTVLAWLRYRERPRRGAYLASLAVFTLALLAKTSTVVLPLVLLGIAAWEERRITRREVLAVSPFLALALVFGALTAWFQQVRSLAGAGYPRGLAERAGGAAWALLAYLRAAFVPVDVPLVAPPWPARPGELLFWAPLAMMIAGGALLAWRWRGPGRPLAFGLGYHALAVLPVLGLVDIAYLRVAPVAGHLQYLALMGPVTLGAAALARTWRPGPWRRVGLAATGATAVALLALSAARANAFQDDAHYWEAAARLAPQSRVAALAHADQLGASGRIAEARATLEGAAARLRDPADRRRAAAVLLVHSGRFEEGLAEARSAQALRPDPFFQRDLGELLIRARRYDDAIAVLDPVVRAYPGSPEHRYWLGSALALSGRLPEAAAVLRPACGASRGHFGTCTALVMVLARMRRAGEARGELAAVLGVPPSDPLVERLLSESGVPEAR